MKNPNQARAFNSRAFEQRINAILKERDTTLNQVALAIGTDPGKLYAALGSERASAEAIGQILRALGLPWGFLDTISRD